MKVMLRKIKGVAGFMPTTYALYDMRGNILKIMFTRKEAEAYAEEMQYRIVTRRV